MKTSTYGTASNIAEAANGGDVVYLPKSWDDSDVFTLAQPSLFAGYIKQRGRQHDSCVPATAITVNLVKMGNEFIDECVVIENALRIDLNDRSRCK